MADGIASSWKSMHENQPHRTLKLRGPRSSGCSAAIHTDTGVPAWRAGSPQQALPARAASHPKLERRLPCPPFAAPTAQAAALVQRRPAPLLLHLLLPLLLLLSLLLHLPAALVPQRSGCHLACCPHCCRWLCSLRCCCLVRHEAGSPAAAGGWPHLQGRLSPL